MVNIIAAPLWLLFGVWMMAIQYIDYPADNHKMSWQDMLAWLRHKRWQSLSFGAIVYLVLLIPLVNVLMMPAAVAGATLFWVRERAERSRPASGQGFLDGGDQRWVVRRGAGRETRQYAAILADQKFLEVPGDVAGVLGALARQQAI